MGLPKAKQPSFSRNPFEGSNQKPIRDVKPSSETKNPSSKNRGSLTANIINSNKQLGVKAIEVNEF